MTLKRLGDYGVPTIIFALLVSLIGATNAYLKPFKSPSASTHFISPSRHLEYFTFGYRELVADLLWLRVIQDLEECDRDIKDGESCTGSWVYKMVNKVTDLSPKFRIVYATVPLVLSLSVRDREGAILLLNKGLGYFPKDWPILYRGGYLYLFDQNDKVKAAEYFDRAQRNGGPDWLAASAARLYSEGGQAELAERLIQEYQDGGYPEALLERMKKHLREATSKQH